MNSKPKEKGRPFEAPSAHIECKTFLFEWRNNQNLPGIDQIRILEHGFVGFEDDRVFPGVTINLLGDL
jgi:hypothetical protein